ncbi:uncharacterized protein LOC126910389 isoform X2 [Daktulosphaira vitifoliae]|nr:uncharacterized protein LOC126910389 isoform X2 [Daktulosphaira vitifoliae]XP_050548888.1 uncharacterized protein LOC126910389 isoform X2 [Daktulosphaira vitifoliae]XP_050548889.1 uncharacterized protein LOC126910389 isoform X2 [Daktulosphaira vitifoliae]
MNTFEITQSSNWYKSNVMALNTYGTLLAYGSRNIVVLVSGLNGNSIYDLVYSRLRFNAKVSCGRIGAVSFSHETDTHADAYYVASIDEVNIYIWKVKDEICEHVHSFGNKKNKNVVLLDVAWLYNCLTVVAISDAGTLHKWDIQAMIMRNYTLDLKVSPLTLAACPHKKNIVALGCKNGSVIVYDVTGDGRVLHKLRYHERNVVSLTWCPVPYNTITNDQSSQPLLLASTACDRTGLYICRAGTDMFCEATISLPMRPIRKTIFKNKTNLIWSCIKWIKPTTIIVTSAFGEILKVDFQLSKISSPDISLISDVHKDVIFSIASSLKASKPFLWSSCMGRKLIRTPLFDTSDNEDFPLEVPTLGGFVYCFALSPVNSADFAFGLGDGRIYYWNVSNRRQLELITLSNSIDAKVLSLAFHPQDEGLLAFGTSDGRIGIFNLIKKRNNMSLLKTVLAHSIYRLCWAPPPIDVITNETKYSLYAVGNGQILIYNEMSLWKDPRNLKEYILFNNIEDELITPVKRIEMAWKQDYDIVAIGNSNGNIYLLDGHTLELRHVILSHDQSVECIIWHPTHVTCDFSEESKFKNYFASSSYCIKVHKLNKDNAPILVAEFNGHKEKVNELAWSPHRNLMLLSCSNDFTAKVWDVQKCVLLGVYSRHLSTVLCGMFSPLDSDIVFTGSADHSIHSWRVSKALQSDSVELTKNQSTPTIIKEKIVTKDVDKLNTTGPSDLSTKDTTNKKQQFPFSSYDLFIGKYLETAVEMYLKPDDQINCENINYLSFFGSAEEMKQLMVEESKVLKKKSSSNIIPYINNINIWGNNLEAYFKEAIETKTVNDWMVSVAPSISFELWVKMCEAYAVQLEDEGDVSKSSTFLVSIKKYKDAALMLLKNNLFKEALSVARCQENQDDELILEITKKWAEYNVCHGHPKEAAHCYLSIGDPRNAISCLTKIKQIKELSLAAKLACCVDEEIELSLVVNILKMEYFKHHKWNEARAFLNEHPKLNYLEMWIGVHESMFEFDEKVTLDIFKDWLFDVNNKNNVTILDHIITKVTWKPEYYDNLVKIIEPEFISDTNLIMPKMTVFIASQFCLIALQYKNTGKLTIDCQQRLIKCLAAAYDYELMCPDSVSKFNKPLTKLIIWFFPKGPLSEENFEIFVKDDNLLKTIRSYLCFACFSWLNPLYTSLAKKIHLTMSNNDEESRINQLKHLNEMFKLIRLFQNLSDKYFYDVLDHETIAFFEAKYEIERIDCLLSGSSALVDIRNIVNDLLDSKKLLPTEEKDKKSGNTYLKFNNDVNSHENNITDVNNDLVSKENNNNKSVIMKHVEHKFDAGKLINTEDSCNLSNNKKSINNYSSLSEQLYLEQISSHSFNDLFNLLTKENNLNSVNLIKFFQNIVLIIHKFNGLLNKPSIQHVAHLEIQASKKKKLENVVSEFVAKRVNAPDSIVFLKKLEKTICSIYYDHMYLLTIDDSYLDI